MFGIGAIAHIKLGSVALVKPNSANIYNVVEFIDGKIILLRFTRAHWCCIYLLP